MVDFPKKMFGYDPSNPDTVRYTYALATEDLAHLAVETAKRHLERFKSSEVEHRADLLKRTADLLKKRRFDLIGVMMADGGKTAHEADTEISEAIDFCNYYSMQGLEFFNHDDVAWEPRGVAVVLPPWNFPCSIPVGCIAASLCVATRWCSSRHRDGLGRTTRWPDVSGMPASRQKCSSSSPARMRRWARTFVSHPDTGLICLTGSNETAKRIYELNAGDRDHCRDGREERDDRDCDGRPRFGDRRHHTVGLRPFGAEVFGPFALDSRERGV